MTHLVASISAHGHGHLAITAPVLERLHALDPDWRLTVSSGLPETALRRRIHCPFDIQSDDLDFGLRMRPDLSVDVEATVADYRAIHDDWDTHLCRRAEWLTRSGCDLLLSNISYLNIAAAVRAGIPAMALSPLNWADLYRHFAPDEPDCHRVFDRMVAAYNKADVFLSPEPCMPAPHFERVEIIPPVVQTGQDRGDEIREAFNLDAHTRLVLLALGGRESALEFDDLPELPGVHWLVDRRCSLSRADILDLDGLGLAFPDVLAGSDLLVCKPGYGAFAEAACLGRPVVYVRRPDWPEEAYLIDWLRKQVTCREARLREPRSLEVAVLELLAGDSGPGCAPDGVSHSVERIRTAVGGNALPGSRCL